MTSARRARGVAALALVVSLLVVPAAEAPARGARAAPVRATGPAPEGKATGGLEVRTRELIVRFAPDAGADARDRVVERTGVRMLARMPGTGLALVRLPAGADAARAIRRYRRMDAVAHVEPNLARPLAETVPTDPLFGEQWGLQNVGQPHSITDPPPDTVVGVADADIDATDAWGITTGSPSTVVAVIDTGIDLTHPDLVASLWVNPGEIAGNGVDDDANGFVDDVNGWDFADDDAVPQDSNGHGTHVSGIIGATIANGEGVVGVCPACRVMPLRFGLDTFGEVAAIDYAIDNGAHVINASFGGSSFSRIERNAIQRAADAGILFVAAAGNEDMNLDILGLTPQRVVISPTFPAAYDLPGVVAVAASNDADRYGSFTDCRLTTGAEEACLFSNFGHDSVDLAAPGVDILSTHLAGGYRLLDGTSMAAPHVAGAAGLVKSVHPEYSALELRNALLNSVNTPPSLTAGLTRTGGRLNVAAALNASTATAHPTSIGNIGSAVGIRSSASGSLSYPTNVNDVFRRRLRKGKTYAVTLDVPDDKDFDLLVYKPGTTQLFDFPKLQALSLGPAGEDELVVFKARRTGTYFIQVEAFFDSGEYELRVYRVR
ncbi:MAG: S8 family peptidase [Actinomycetota bacterium]